MLFQDEFDWRPVHVLNGQLKVPERAKSETARWELCTLEMDYNSDQLYQWIADAKTAKARGWNVEVVRQAIMKANPEFARGGMYRDWEWHQQQLKQGSMYYAMTSSVIRMVHLFFREFAKKGESEGRVSHVCILADRELEPQNIFLFQKIGQYASWDECVHPMYYDRGSGGFHHGVTGMGIKMFSVMELQNRTLCTLADKAMAPRQIFTPSTASQAEDFALVEHGDYAVLKEGWTLGQAAIHGAMEEPMQFNREITGLIASNLSQYRQNIQKEQGNPITATEAQQRASEAARLNKTQMNRYYIQRDRLLAEMYRRVVQKGYTKDQPGGARAAEFIERCKKDGVPDEAIRKPELVKASRVIGQGSEFMRQQSLGTLFQTVIGMLPEGGRDNLITDLVSSFAGQSAVERYYPPAEIRKQATDQEAEAMQWVSAMKTGLDVVVTDTQNPLIYAATFLAAGDQAAASLEKGADPMQVAVFLDSIGRNTVPYLQRLQRDPSREQIFKQLQTKWTELAKIQDKLEQHIQEQQQQMAEQQAAQNQAMSDQQFEQMLAGKKLEWEMDLKRKKTEFGLQDKAAKTQFGMFDQARRTAQDLAISDAEASQSLRHAEMEARAKQQQKSNGASE